MSKRILVFKQEGIVEENYEKEKKKRRRKESIDIWEWATQLGLEIALPIVGGGLIGSFLDSQWGTKPKLTLSLLFFGVVVSFYVLFKTTRIDNE